jgi:hypothetical protein
MPMNAQASHRKKKNAKQSRSHLCLARSLAVAAHDLHPVRGNGCLVVELEGDILDQERPDFVAEPVSVEVALFIVTKRERGQLI